MPGRDWPRRRDRHNCDLRGESRASELSSRAGLATQIFSSRCKLKNWENMDPHNFVKMGMHTLLYSNQIILKWIYLISPWNAPHGYNIKCLKHLHFILNSKLTWVKAARWINVNVGHNNLISSDHQITKYAFVTEDWFLSVRVSMWCLIHFW